MKRWKMSRIWRRRVQCMRRIKKRKGEKVEEKQWEKEEEERTEGVSLQVCSPVEADGEVSCSQLPINQRGGTSG